MPNAYKIIMYFRIHTRVWPFRFGIIDNQLCVYFKPVFNKNRNHNTISMDEDGRIGFGSNAQS